MANNTVRRINIIGHQNPDTDSICSALAYAWLKNRGSLTGLYEARRAGHVNRETRFVLQHFGVEPPAALQPDVSPQIKDIDIRKQAGIDGEMSLRAAWNLMRDVEIDTLCIVDSDNELQGLITIKDIADANMDLFDTAVLAAANTRCTNLLETLEADWWSAAPTPTLTAAISASAPARKSWRSSSSPATLCWSPTGTRPRCAPSTAAHRPSLSAVAPRCRAPSWHVRRKRLRRAGDPLRYLRRRAAHLHRRAGAPLYAHEGIAEIQRKYAD